MARQTSSEWEAEMANEGKLARLEAEIERLRQMHSDGVAMLDKAASECVRPKAEIERLRAALENIANMDPDNRHLSIRQVQDIAIVALEQSDGR